VRKYEVGDYEACRVFSYLSPLAGESIGRLRRPFLEPDFLNQYFVTTRSKSFCNNICHKLTFDVVNLHEPIPRTRSSKVEQKSGERASPFDLDQ
jgi:hypothetical protein